MLSSDSFFDGGRFYGQPTITGSDTPRPEVINKAIGVAMLATGGAMVLVGSVIPGAENFKNAGSTIYRQGLDKLNGSEPNGDAAQMRAAGLRAKAAINSFMRRKL